ncbi:RluA family pseudouridine synthase [Corynebacterium heidelbergense]|uniref:Pseudouridine synthase n=1 Tax=Corynebacterium heidelbergense TaxID=2055947 RepID=A0A364V994_9CORY|nr:RluA family pseudouridine synthase [Corynebacterium heidelbergense]RAV33230.1 RNA pseudouridine synthase [Corynebacterium heidelbergense]WCZ36387.1 Ribosomal large subunit pseudouridine synthase D [Corynebacterium heidelbergense]
MRESKMLPVPDGLAGLRVDAGLSKLLGLSRTVTAQLAEAGEVRQDGVVVGKSARLLPGSWLDVLLPEPQRDLAAEPPREVEGMDILFSDDDVICVDKPVGVAAHPTLGWEGPTVTSGLAAAGFRISTSGPPERKGIVQRLDVGTSGVMIVAASERAYTQLKRAFRNREVTKTYHALVQGHPDPSAGTIDAPIGRHHSAGWRFAVREDGKHAVTHYETLEAHRQASLLRVRLETGRTHQIRVHFEALHHPLCGDPMYGSDPELNALLGLNRQWLHAVSLGFTHPSGQWMTVKSPYPEDLDRALTRLREANGG